VCDAANLIEVLVQQQVSWRVGGGPPSTLDDVAFKIDNCNVAGLELGVGNTARLDDYMRSSRVDPTGVSECECYEAMLDQGPIGATNLLFEFFQHGLSLTSAVANCNE
jgi:hypothetical protein